jgi:hypothetical protein
MARKKTKGEPICIRLPAAMDTALTEIAKEMEITTARYLSLLAERHLEPKTPADPKGEV